MKKRFFTQAVIVFFFFACCFFITKPLTASAQGDILTLTQNNGYQTSEFYKPKSSIVISADTGQILWEDNIDLKWNPASIVKLMTAYLVFEAIEKGQFTLEDQIVANESDQAISQIYALSNNNIVAGVSYSVSDLLYATLVQSSNVATVMLANLVSNNDAAAFIHSMNTTAQALGMTNSTFYNCSGASSSSFEGYYTPEGIDPDADNVSTARDLATLSYYLLQKYPKVLIFTSPAQQLIMAGTSYEEVLENHNYSLPSLAYGYEGVDGLKTGSSPTGGFNYAATAVRGDTRLIEIILGVGSWEDPEGELQRHAFGNTLFDQAFETYEYKKLLDAGANTVNEEEIILANDFYGVVQKSTTPIFILTDDTLSLNNGLNTVSTSISSPVDMYQVVKKEKTITAIVKKTTSKMPLIIAIFTALFLGSLFLLLGTMRKQHHQTKSYRKPRYPLIILGMGLFIIGIAMIIYTFLLT